MYTEEWILDSWLVLASPGICSCFYNVLLFLKALKTLLIKIIILLFVYSQVFFGGSVWNANTDENPNKHC